MSKDWGHDASSFIFVTILRIRAKIRILARQCAIHVFINEWRDENTLCPLQCPLRMEIATRSLSISQDHSNFLQGQQLRPVFMSSGQMFRRSTTMRLRWEEGKCVIGKFNECVEKTKYHSTSTLIGVWGFRKSNRPRCGIPTYISYRWRRHEALQINANVKLIRNHRRRLWLFLRIIAIIIVIGVKYVSSEGVAVQSVIGMECATRCVNKSPGQVIITKPINNLRQLITELHYRQFRFISNHFYGVENRSRNKTLGVVYAHCAQDPTPTCGFI